MRYHGRSPKSTTTATVGIPRSEETMENSLGCVGIQGGERIIEESQRRPRVDRPGEGEASFLTAGKRHPTLTDLGLISSWQLVQVRKETGCVEGFIVLLLVEVETKQDIVSESAVQYEGCLVSKSAALLSTKGEIQGRSGERSGVAQKSIDESAFSATDRPNDGAHVSSSKIQLHPSNDEARCVSGHPLRICAALDRLITTSITAITAATTATGHHERSIPYLHDRFL